MLSADWPEQRNWLQTHGLNRENLAVSEFPDEDLAIAAARQGLGITVESLALVEDDLRTGRLHLLIDGQESLPAYFVVTQNDLPRKPARIFLAWLLRQG